MSFSRGASTLACASFSSVTFVTLSTFATTSDAFIYLARSARRNAPAFVTIVLKSFMAFAVQASVSDGHQRLADRDKSLKASVDYSFTVSEDLFFTCIQFRRVFLKLL